MAPTHAAAVTTNSSLMPVSSAAAEVIAAEHDIAQQNLLKKSVKKTILAGDTGGFNPMGQNPANAPGSATTFRKK